ncbi:unnamed protein product [Auanema sp. JU1783]|nr:unnamed protein product [Auanema sp. JU1783]
MFRVLLATALFGAALCNICTDETGKWSFGIADGLKDFYHGGAPLNRSNNCFEGCLYTATVVQNFKVKLAGNTTSNSEQRYITLEERLNRLQADDQDPNKDSCVSDSLRASIAKAISSVSDNSCKGVIRAIQYNVNRPGWVFNCVALTGGSIDSIFQDDNFCDYDAVVGKVLYTLRLALIDTN